MPEALGQPLGRRHADPQAGEQPRPDVEGDRIHLAQGHPGPLEHRLDRRREILGMSAATGDAHRGEARLHRRRPPRRPSRSPTRCRAGSPTARAPNGASAAASPARRRREPGAAARHVHAPGVVVVPRGEGHLERALAEHRRTGVAPLDQRDRRRPPAARRARGRRPRRGDRAGRGRRGAAGAPGRRPRSGTGARA